MRTKKVNVTTLPARRPHVVALAALTCGALVLTGCTTNDQQAADTSSEVSHTATELEAPEVSVKDEATDVDPSKTMEVTSKGDGLKDVTMTNEAGGEVEDTYSVDRNTWKSDEHLGYGRTYTINATDKNGEKTSVSFTTIAPAGTANVAFSPIDGSTVGVGQTVNFRFSQVINDREKAEKALSVTTEPAVEGAFYWVNGQEVRWRPKDYWEPGTKVTAKADIYGQSLGGGIYGQDDYETSFTIGDDVRTVVDDNTKMMTVTKNGEKLKSIPVSLGSSQYPTPNGVYIIGDRNKSMTMDSETFGLAHDAGGYRTEVEYATQMSYSGIYVHAAPWSVWAQGNTNQSHGCINVTTEAAKWFQETVKAGDIVTVKNTEGGELNGLDGLGDWNIPWEIWKAGNANQ